MMVPVDVGHMEGRRMHGWHYTDIVCDVCKSPWGGLIYHDESGIFTHRQPSQCGLYMKKSLR